MILFHTVSGAILLVLLGLLFHETVRNEIVSTIDRDSKTQKVVAYASYVLIAVMIAYLWPVSLIVLGIVAILMWGVGHDYFRR